MSLHESIKNMAAIRVKVKFLSRNKEDHQAAVAACVCVGVFLLPLSVFLEDVFPLFVCFGIMYANYSRENPSVLMVILRFVHAVQLS